jgi:hypothetical protein
VARVHSKETVIIIDDNDISVYCTDSNRKRSGQTEDNTTYGKDDVVKDPTLGTGEFGCGGKYDSAAAGPRAVLDPLVNTKVNIKYRPEGTGSGLPQDSFDAVITGYEETAPVAGYRMWVLTTEPSDTWDTADQA